MTSVKNMVIYNSLPNEKWTTKATLLYTLTVANKTDKFRFADWNARKLMANAAVEAYNNPIHMIDVEIMVFSIRDTAFVFWSGEVFVEYGKRVRDEFYEKKFL